MARTMYLTTQLTKETFEAVIDASNFWGESRSKTAEMLVQRGLMALDKELGSNTPAHIKVARINQSLNSKMDTRQRIEESYRLANELNDDEALAQIEELAKEFKVKL